MGERSGLGSAGAPLNSDGVPWGPSGIGTAAAGAGAAPAAIMRATSALRTATVHAADLLGMTDCGTIEPGKLADLVAVAGNPLVDITATERVSWVMVGGRVVRASR